MKNLTILLFLLISGSIWSEVGDCFEQTPISIEGRIEVRQIEGLPELNPETGRFTSTGMIPIYLLETEDTVCFITERGLINNSKTNQIQLILEEHQLENFATLVGKIVTLSIKNYFEGTTKYYIRPVAFSGIELLKL